MSSSYVQEPATRGKVILHTDKGPIDIELWPKEAPLATRNFVQLCLDQYYDQTIFHRLVKGFILQGGDPTGTGHGGDSYHGQPIPVERHQRLRFSRRGLVAHANGTGSQFFITLDRADELQNKHTIFGKVVGNTLFNVLDMADQRVDEQERPRIPPVILRTEVVDNPFDDVVPRHLDAVAQRIRAQSAASSATTTTTKAPKAAKVTKRSLALLSFGDDEGPGSSPVVSKRIKSSHDVLQDESLSSRPAVEDEALAKPKSTTRDHRDPPAPSSSDTRRPRDDDRPPSEPAPESTPAPTLSSAAPSSTTPSMAAPPPPAATAAEKPKKKKRDVPLWQQERAKYASSARAAPSKDTDVLAALSAFQAKLRDIDVPRAPRHEVEDDRPLCFLHSVPGCLSCTDSFAQGGGGSDDEGEGWLAHRLTFQKDRAGVDLVAERAKRMAEDDGYVVIDPRAERARGGGAAGTASPAGGREWDRDRGDRGRGDRDRDRGWDRGARDSRESGRRRDRR
ncbi:Peptidyl-prolyl isomerase cwc27 [Allomyces javanicus]|nr:Peptidyl-prolyl isomerase cwc27 [Allomyces javanicus]